MLIKKDNFVETALLTFNNKLGLSVKAFLVHRSDVSHVICLSGAGQQLAVSIGCRELVSTCHWAPVATTKGQ